MSKPFFTKEFEMGRVTNEVFVATYLELKSVKALAKKLKIGSSYASQWVSRLRKAGVNMPKFKKAKSGNAVIDIQKLNEMIATHGYAPTKTKKPNRA